MSSVSGIGLLTSFGAGVISFLSPCVLPLVPGYVSYVAGDALVVSGEPVRPLAALRLSLCFVLGFSTVFVILGASATTIGQLLLAYRSEENLVGGAIVLLFGLFMMGLAKLSCCSGSSEFIQSSAADDRSPPTSSASRSPSAGRRISARCSVRS